MELRYTIIIVTLIICLFFVWFFSHKAKHQEKMLRIEMGITEVIKDSEKSIFSHLWLKLAFLVIGQGLAFLIISILVAVKWLNNDGLPIAIFALMGGISMLVAHKVVSKKQKN